jgi:ATP-binding cassette subfamily B protein
MAEKTRGVPERGGHGPGSNRHGFQKPKNVRKTLGMLMRYVGRYKALLALVAVCILINSGVMVAGSYMIKPVINNYIIPRDFAGLARMLAILGVVYLCGAGAGYANARLMVHIAQNTVRTMRRDLFEKMQSLPVRYFDSRTHGELMSRYTNDIDTVSEAINMSFANLITSSLTFCGIVVMMLVLNWTLTIITAVFLALIFLVAGKIGQMSKLYFSRQQAAIGDLGGYVEEMIEGQKVIKVFCHEEEAKAGFSVRNEALRDAATNAQFYAGSMMPALGNLSYLSYAVNCCAGALLVIGGHLDIGSLVAYLQYVRQVSQPISQISQQINMVYSALAGAERVFEMMAAEPETDEGTVTLVRARETENGLVRDGENGTVWAWDIPAGENSPSELRPLLGDVRFEHVVFGYEPEKTVLRDVSLFAKPGQKIAFVGSTGAGKTTITNLINRFYEIEQGKITYDGIDVRDIKKESLRRSLGMVLQDTHLFTGTIADNIRYSRPDATDAEVVAAAKLANAHSFIRGLPNGYETKITGDGENLSQGQRQLLSIARAAVANPPVLILDEATSSIDTRTEKLIEKGMDRLMRDKTVFVIAHRLSTIRNAKAIMVLEHGEIIERGTHEALLEERGRYYRLHTGQAELA